MTKEGGRADKGEETQAQLTCHMLNLCSSWLFLFTFFYLLEVRNDNCTNKTEEAFSSTLFSHSCEFVADKTIRSLGFVIKISGEGFGFPVDGLHVCACLCLIAEVSILFGVLD